MAAAIELDGALEADGRGHVALGRGLGELLLGHVEVVDVGGVMLAVVQLHDLGADDRLQRVVVIGQVGQRVLAADTENRTSRREANVKFSKSNLVFLTRVAEDSLKTCLEIVLANISVNV